MGAIAVLFLLFVVIAIILFKSRFFVFLNRLAKTEFRNAENQQTKPKILSREISTKPWPWYKAWENSLLKPNDDAAKELLLKGHVSFRQAYMWIVVAFVIFQLLYSIVFWIKSPFLIDFNSIFNLVKNCLLVGLLAPISLIVLTGFIHILAKLFRSKGTFRSFFIIYITFTTPILLLFIIAALIWQVSRIQIFLLFGVLISFYYELVLPTQAIKANYRFHWRGAFFLNLFAQVVFFLSIVGLLIMGNPGLINK